MMEKKNRPVRTGGASESSKYDLQNSPQYSAQSAERTSNDYYETREGTWVAKKPVANGAQPEDESEHRNDAGNARRLVAQHGRDLLYCVPWRKWLVWDGQRWRVDDQLGIWRRAKATATDIYAEAAAARDATERKELAAWAGRSESEPRLAAMISLARSEPGIPVRPDDLDGNRYLLNAENGTINLRTGRRRPHARDDLITKLAPVEFDANAKCPIWEAFLDRVMGGNASLIEFLQRSIGYSLTGDVSEQVLFFFYGRGANGKSTLLNTILALLGDYGRQAAPGLLTMKRNDAHPTERADLMGARFVASIEVEQGRRLAEALVKELTGGDRQKARFMRGDFFEWEPTHKLVLAVNHRPVVRGTDLAIWRRIRLVPFNVAIPPDEQDRQLAAKLRGEAAGILAWAIEGCLAWQRDGLGAPTEVIEATASYRAEQDTLGAFISDECRLAENAKATAKDLYAAYRAWCKAHGEEPTTQTAFGLQLGERGLTASRGRGARWWQGIGLAAQPTLDDGREREA